MIKNYISKKLAFGICSLLLASSASAQLSGVKTIPGDYPTIAAAVTDLNTQLVGAGGVTFNVAAGHTETSSNIVITATGNSADPVVFQKSGVGANPLITASAGTGTLDGIIILSAADYITFDGIDVTESAANTTPTTQMEWGYALLKSGPANGSQYNTIRNSAITLNRTYSATIGIWAGNHTPASATVLTLTSVNGANSFNRIYTNTISNVHSGVIFNGFNDVTPFAFYDIANEVGGTSAGTGNMIMNFGGAAATTYGVRGIYQNGMVVGNNTINNTMGGGISGAGVFYGVMHSTGTNSSATITGNVISLAQGSVTSGLNGIYSAISGTGSVSVTNNHITGCSTSATSSAFNGITMNASPATVTITGNRIFNNTSLLSTGSVRFIDNGGGTTVNISNNRIYNNSTASTTTVYGIYNNVSASSVTVNNNYISQITRTGTGASTFYGYYNFGSPTTGTETITGDTVSSITQGGTSSFYGIYSNTGSGQNKVITSNVVYTISSGSGSSYGINSSSGNIVDLGLNKVFGLTTSGTTYGIAVSGATTTVRENLVFGLSSSTNVYGYSTLGGTTLNFFRNKVYDLTTTTTATGVVYGVYVNGGTTITVANNLIGDLKAPTANPTNSNSVSGIYVGSGTTANLYYNTIYLNASSTGTNFGTSGIYFASTPTVDIRNSIVINLSTPAGTGTTAALRRGAAGFTNLATSTNNNIYYAGTPSATNLIFTDGTAAYQTLGAYQTATSRDGSSHTENTAFVSTAGVSSGFLHIDPTQTTKAESNAAAISITDDYDAVNIRTGYPLAGQINGGGTAPDIGADEGDFRFVPLSDVGLTGLGSPVAGESCRTNENLSVTVKNFGNGTLDFSTDNVIITLTITGPNPMTITDTITGGTLAAGASTNYPMMTGYNMSAFGTYVFNATATLSGDANTANNSMPSVSIVTSALTASASANPDTVCSGTPSQLTVGYPGSRTVGTGSLTNTSNTYPTPYGNYYYGSRSQFLITAAELTAAGIIPGPITSLAFDVSSTNGSAALTNFEIKMKSTNISAITAFQSGLTTVKSAATTAVTTGWNTHVFTTPFVWDGTSNIIIETCFNNTGYNTNASVRQTSTSFASTVYYREDATGVCSNNSVTASFNQRPNMRFDATTTPASVTWNPSSGLSSSSVYNPTATLTSTATYTATVTNSSGCTATSTVTVNVLPIPTAPTATNSTQCGPGIPTASVSGTGTMQWYDAATGGTLLQNGGNTYATSVSATDTFYVAAFDGSCSSTRTMVVVTVTSSDPIVASANNTTLCTGGSATLTVSSTNANYTYTWSPAASLNTAANDTVIATPTATTTYTVSASDNLGCTAGATVVINVNPVPVATPTATPASICPGGSSQLIVPPVQIGNGTITNSATSYPAPYGNYYYGARHQILVRASELSAAGLVAGPITSLAFDVSNVNLAQPHVGFEIKMKATSLTALTASFETGLTTVAPGTTYQPVLGWNVHTFATPFNWDGVSNIIIETCFNNTNYDDNASVRQTATSYVSVVYYRADAAGVCSNPAVTSTASQRPNMRFGSGNYSYSWSPSASLSNGSIANPIATPGSTTTYTVSITNTNTGCIGTSSVAVTVLPGADAGTISGPSAVCPGTSATLTVSGTEGTVQWYMSTDDNNYTAVAGATDTFYVTPALTDTIYYGVIATNGTCTDTSAVTLQINMNPAVSATATSTGVSCFGGSDGTATANAGAGTFTYQWNTTPAQTTATATGLSAGTYQAIVTNGSGCTDTVSATVTQPTALVLNTSSTSPSCAGGTNGSATANVTGGTASYTYSWSGNASTSSTATGLSAGTYTVEVTDANGCTISGTVTVTDPAPFVISTSGNTAICSGDSVSLTATGATMYSWNTGATSASVNVNPTVTTTYVVTGTNSSGCTDSDTITVVVENAVTASFTYNTMNGLDFDFTAGAAANYSWNFGDATTGSGQNVSHTFAPGTYNVELIVSNACGSDTSIQTIVAIGTSSKLASGSISLYPNPSKGEFTLEVISTDENSVVSILDMNGRIVAEDKIQGNSIFKRNFDLTSYAKGVYSVKLTNSLRTETLRFVLN